MQLSRTIPARHFVLLAFLSAFLAFNSRQCYAVTGVEFRLPNVPKYPSGLSMHVDARGVDANGYRPVRLTVSAWPLNKPLRSDRQLRVVLHTGRMGTWRDSRVSQVIELRKSTTSTTATILIPQVENWSSFSIETFEGGERLLDLSQNQISWALPNGWNWSESKPAMLFLDSHVPPHEEKNGIIQAYESTQADPSPTHDLPDVRSLLRLFSENENQRGMPGSGRGASNRAATTASAAQTISDTALLALMASRTRSEMISPHELPKRWLEISQFDVTTISLADLIRLHKNQPLQFTALHDWLSTGPLLIVYGVGEQFAELAELERLLALQPLEIADVETSHARGWTRPSAESYASALQNPLNEQFPPVTPSFDSPASGPPENPQPPSPPPFLFRRAGAGCLVAINAEKPFPGKPFDWNWIFQAVPENHWQSSNRTGVSYSRANGDYWKLLVPGVGRAPVKSFLVLVSFFAIVIGPLNYWLLARARRLYLLLLTVPIGAVLVTLSLFGFAVVADGLGMRLRIRSYCELDQQTGRATVLSWQSYYAAVAPSAGLRFPDDTVVVPLLANPNASAHDRSTLLVWDGDQQFRGGYLSSRTPTQFVVTRATTTRARLLVNPDADSASPPSVENQLGATIKLLVLRDRAGSYFTASAITSNSKCRLTATDLLAAQADLQAIADSVKPGDPEGFDITDQNDNLLTIFGVRRWRYANNNEVGAGEMSLSLLETNLASATRPSTAPSPMLPGTYLAILDHSPLVVTGVGQATEEQSLHLLRGRY